MNYETTANPAGDDDTRLEQIASSEAGTEALDADDGMAEPPGDGEGESDDRSDEDDADWDGGATAEVEYDGRTYEVPKPLKEAFLRQADYTRKTMELADHRRAFADDKADLEQARAMTIDELRAASRLHDIDTQLGDFAQQDWANLNPHHPSTAELRAVVGQLINEQRMLHSKLSEHHLYNSARAQQEMARTRAETDQEMAREFRDWSPARRQALEEFAVDLGIPNEDIGHASAAEMRILNLAYQGAHHLERQRAANRGAYRPAAEIGGSAGGGPSDPSRMSMAQYRAWRAKQK